MNRYRLTVNRKNGRVTVELAQSVEWKPWRFLGVVPDMVTAGRLIRAGWPDAEGNPTTDNSECHIEVVR